MQAAEKKKTVIIKCIKKHLHLNQSNENNFSSIHLPHLNSLAHPENKTVMARHLKINKPAR